jgi:hypothetical protein
LKKPRSLGNIATWSLIVAVCGIALTFFVPEVRIFLGLEKRPVPKPVQKPDEAKLSETVKPQPESPKVEQRTKTNVKGNKNVAGNNVKGDKNVIGNQNHVQGDTTVTHAPGGIVNNGGTITSPVVNNYASPPVMPKPEIRGIFLEATSPGVAIENLTEGSVVSDAMLVISAWNLDTKESLPTYSHKEEMFIKSGKGVILGSCDNPSMRGHIKRGDRVFAYVEIDCPNCARAKHYWMFFEYGGPSWYSPIADDAPVDMVSVVNLLYRTNWDFDVVWTQLPHGDRLPPRKTSF